MVLNPINNNSEVLFDTFAKVAKKGEDKKAEKKDAEESSISSATSSEGYSVMGCIAAPFVFVGNVLWRLYRAVFCCDYAGEGSKTSTTSKTKTEDTKTEDKKVEKTEIKVEHSDEKISQPEAITEVKTK